MTTFLSGALNQISAGLRTPYRTRMSTGPSTTVGLSLSRCETSLLPVRIPCGFASEKRPNWRCRRWGGVPAQTTRMESPTVVLGIGCIIGSDLFSLTGIAAAEHAGPAVALSFLIAAVGCGLSGMCYSEFATLIPISGSAYTYAYATLGELLAWIIGWDLVLEYAVGAATVSVSWSRYVVELLGNFGVTLPARWVACPFDTVRLPDGTLTTGLINLPAILVIVAITLVLSRGTQESSRVNAIIVMVKIAVVVVFVAVGVFFIK